MRIKLGIIALISILFMWFAVGTSFSYVLALKSKDLPQYEQAISGFASERDLWDEGIRIVDICGGKTVEEEIRAYDERPRLILCLGLEALEAACSIKEIPKVFCMVSHSKAESILSRNKGEAIHGVVIDLPSLTQFKLIRDVFPKLRSIGVMYDPALSQQLIDEASASAKSLKLELISQPVRSMKDVPVALDYLKDKMDLLWSLFDNTAYGPETSRYSLMYLLKRSIPVVGFSPQYAKAGALISLYGDYMDMGRQAALIAKMITDRKEPLEKIVMPRCMRIAVNKKVAEAMGVSFPAEFLKTVDECY